jgi:hypothetical protein
LGGIACARLLVHVIPARKFTHRRIDAEPAF